MNAHYLADCEAAVRRLARDLGLRARDDMDMATLAAVLRSQGDELLLQLLDGDRAALAEIHYQSADSLAGAAQRERL